MISAQPTGDDGPGRLAYISSNGGAVDVSESPNLPDLPNLPAAGNFPDLGTFRIRRALTGLCGELLKLRGDAGKGVTRGIERFGDVCSVLITLTGAGEGPKDG